MSDSPFIIDKGTLDQLEFSELIRSISELCHTQSAIHYFENYQFFVDKIRIQKELDLTFQCWKYIKHIGLFDDERWMDLSTIDASWVIANKTISASELVVFKQILTHYQFIYQSIKTVRQEFTALSELILSTLPVEIVLKKLDRVLDTKGDIFDHASSRLSNIRQELSGIERKIQAKANDLLHEYNKLGVLSNNQLTIKNGRLVLPVHADDKRKVKGFIHDVSGSGQTIFIEPQALVELNNQWMEWKGEEQQEIQNILFECSELVRLNKEAILKIENKLIEFDIIHAKAKFLQPFQISIPNISSIKQWKILNGYHPLLFLHHQKKKLTTIPLNFELGETEQFVLISGPNAGGKSVTLKTIGLFQLMVQFGLPLPADDETLFPIVRSVHSVLGDKQSLEHDLSSFSGHISALKKIIEHAVTNNALVLIDEICSGTDPIEGQALAIEILLGFVRSGYFGVVTSHYGELKKFASEQKGFCNASMIFDTQTLTPTYLFRKGIPGSSYALELVRRIGLDENIIVNAQNRIKQEDQSVEQLNFQLETLISENQKQKQWLESENIRLTQLLQQLESKQKQLKENEKSYKHQIKQSYQIEFDQLKRNLFFEIEQLKKQKISNFKKIENSFSEKFDAVEKKLNEQPENITKKIVVGDRVKLKGGSQSGEVVSIADDDVVIQFETMKLSAKRSEVIYVGKNIPNKKSLQDLSKSKIEINPAQEYQQEINLLGLTVPEAIEKVDHFLSQAVYYQYPAFRIVHGKGTGALRKAIHDFLSKHSDVKAYQLAEWFEGSTGATIVTLK